MPPTRRERWTVRALRGLWYVALSLAAAGALGFMLHIWLRLFLWSWRIA